MSELRPTRCAHMPMGLFADPSILSLSRCAARAFVVGDTSRPAPCCAPEAFSQATKVLTA